MGLPASQAPKYRRSFVPVGLEFNAAVPWMASSRLASTQHTAPSTLCSSGGGGGGELGDSPPPRQIGSCRLNLSLIRPQEASKKRLSV